MVYIDMNGFEVSESSPELTLVHDSDSILGEGAFCLSTPADGGRVICDIEHLRSVLDGGFLVFDAYHEMDFTLGLTVSLSDVCGFRLDFTLGLLPNLPTTLSIPMWALDGQTIFLPRTPGRMKGTCFGHKLSPSRIDSISIGLPASTSQQAVWISGLRWEKTEPTYRVPDMPVVDELGQWTAKTWPGKTKDAAELTDYLSTELNAVLSEAVSFPVGWNEYGGWSEKRFEATGFFRTHHDGQRWWLVDPSGCAFFSTGIDCMMPGSPCHVLGNESLLTWLPAHDAEYSDAWSSRGTSSFCFMTANAIRSWGKDWRDAWEKVTAARMREWGINTVGNWSDMGFAKRAKVPYVWQPNGFPETARTIFRDFPDVFDVEYEVNCKAFAQGLAPHKDDPYMVGYFMRNEPHWAFGENNIAEYLLASHEDLTSKVHLLQFLADRYGDIGGLSLAWGRQFASFDDLIGQENAASFSEASSHDLWDFTAVLVEKYVSEVCKACRQVDPNHLNLGIRYAWISSEACLAGARYFDVFSINMYRMEPDSETISKAATASGLPVIIGEYHWGALDRGLPSSGLRAVPDQAERGVAYEWYLENALADKNLVGIHYFQLNDQPVLGRHDGENFQIGFVDVCHRPYAELTSAARRVHERMYDMACGNVARSARMPIEVPRQGF